VPSHSSGSSGLAQRYAGALFELADEAKAVAAVAKDLETVSAMLSESPDLSRLIRSPVVSRDDQGRAMAAVLAAAGIGDLTGKFVGLLARNGRLFALPDMIAAFNAILARRRGETTADVVAAKPLSAAQLEAVGAAIKAAVGSNVSIVERVDPSLLGGMIVKVGSRMVDSSLRTKLQRLRLAMKGV
jgi:F-type H+-transporting ATPase subunit delta